VLRCHGPQHDVRAFKVFSAKALGGIENGTLPDTVRDRCIAIAMRRKTKGDKVERWLLQRTAPDATRLHDRIAAWAQQATETLTNAVPEALTDRQQEAWWALLAIADLADGEWPDAARDAAVSLAARQDDVSVGVRLLAAIRDLMADRSAISTGTGLPQRAAGLLAGARHDRPRRRSPGSRAA
jgi:hypothetical protein